MFSFDTLTIKRTALLEKLPSLTKDDSGSTGLIYADGPRITVSPTTSVSFKPNLAERRNSGRDNGTKAPMTQNFYARFSEPRHICALRSGAQTRRFHSGPKSGVSARRGGKRRSQYVATFRSQSN